MLILCPDCHKILDPATLRCPQGHHFQVDENGVLCLLNQQTKSELAPFAEAISQKRQSGSYPLSDPAVYDSLPCAPLDNYNKEWQWRCDDLAIVRRLMSRRLPNQSPKRILDVGAFNGWLSHNLAADGHTVTAADYCAGPFDGLGAVQHYTHTFQAIQIDLADLTTLNSQFDVIIMNHGLPFFPDPIAHIRQLLDKLAPNGLLLIIGLIIYRNPVLRKRYLARAKEKHLAEYGRPLLFRPAPGYLDHNHKNALQNLGLTHHPHPRFHLHNRLSRLLPIIPWRGHAHNHP
jgi:SAM-dependent methyltransferase